MSKRRRARSRPAAPVNYAELRERQKAIDLLSRTLRRIKKGMHIPFLVATVEPFQIPGEPELHAKPMVASRGIDDPKSRIIVRALMSHLIEIGALQKEAPAGGQEAPKEPEKGLETRFQGENKEEG